jgi:hypothetical protein
MSMNCAGDTGLNQRRNRRMCRSKVSGVTTMLEEEKESALRSAGSTR